LGVLQSCENECGCDKYKKNFDKADLAFWTPGELRLQTAAVKVDAEICPQLNGRA